jgi:twinkle protein
MTWKELHIPCPCGKSSDAYALREDGSGYCFRGDCLKNFRSEEKLEDLSDEFVLKPYAHRGISEKTFNQFNANTKFIKEGEQLIPHSIGFVYPNGAIKIRKIPEKEIWAKGPMASATLYLKNFFDPGSKRCITIVEGEYDALAAAQILGHDSAVVSVRSSGQALGDCKKEWEYINSFEKIVINLDNDAVGQEAAKKVLSLFDFKKTYNLVLERHKDANAYLWDGEKVIEEGSLYYQAWRGVKRHTPDNIVSGNLSFFSALKDEREACIATYPFTDLQSKLYGIHEGEVVILKAEEGIGKTEVFRAFEDHVIKTTKHPIGIIHLEEDNGTTLRGMAAYYSDTPIHLPDSNASIEDVFNIIKEINGPDEGRIFLRSAFDVEDEDAFLNGIRFLVSVCGCRLIYLDHISWLATGTDDQDERKKLDRLSQKFKLLAKELRFGFIIISHVNDDGKTRGSRNISKVGNTVINIKRDKLHPDENERRKTFFEIEKARLMGAQTGPAGYAIYDLEVKILKQPDSISIGLP